MKLNRGEKNGAGIFVGLVLVAIMLAIGWVMNVIELFHATEVTGMVIARGIGVILAPLGGVLGWL